MAVIALGWPDGPIPAGAPLVIILVPSLGTTATMFEGLRHELATRIPGAPMIAVDLPGHGSAPSADAVSVERLADEIVGSLEAARPDRAIVVGVSMGGAVALEVARRYPLLGFVQVNSGTSFGTAAGWASLIEEVVRGGTASLLPSSSAGWFAEEFRSSSIARAILSELDAIDDRTYVACCHALARYRGDTELRSLHVPALLIGTADDQATPASAMRQLVSRLPNAQYHELPEGGHLSPTHHPGEVADTIAVWLSPLIRTPYHEGEIHDPTQ